MSERHSFSFFENQKQGQEGCKAVTDRLCDKNSVNAKEYRKEIDEGYQEDHLSQQGDYSGWIWPVNGLEEGSGQHYKAQKGSNAEIDSQASNSNLKHFLGSSKSSKNLFWKNHYNQPDKAGYVHRKNCGQPESIHDPFMIARTIIIA